MSYDRLAEEAERRPKKAADWSATWAKLTPVGSVNGQTKQRLERFCESKRLTLAGLEALGARVAIRKGNKAELAFAGTNGADAVCAIKYRPLEGSSHDSHAENPSAWLRPIVAGNRDSLDWLLAEGETDAARLVELVGDLVAIIVLPAGARTFKREWAALIPRGARVGLCHDADEEGDAGAEKAATLLGGRTHRIRPPIAGGDWCDWAGDREEFLALAKLATSAARYEFASLAEFLAHNYPKAEPLLGEPGAVFLARGSLLMVYGADGSGKSTWSIDGIVHLAAGVPWLGIPVPRPVRVCIIENEGPPDLFQQKLAAKLAGWEERDPSPNLFAFRGPWGEFSFANPEAREALIGFCEEHAIDLVAANPTLGLGVAASGRPDETQQFVDWLVECGLKGERAFWLCHHENKAGQISGDWGRHPDTKVALQQDGSRPRTNLEWAKTRWATLPSETIAKAVMLEWVVETQGYTVTELDMVGASDAELEERIADFLADHPQSTTTAVWEGVKGTNERIRRLLEGDRFERVEGPRNAIFWRLATDAGVSASEMPDALADALGTNPHEHGD
jgi:hypothetical protein